MTACHSLLGTSTVAGPRSRSRVATELVSEQDMFQALKKKLENLRNMARIRELVRSFSMGLRNQTQILLLCTNILFYSIMPPRKGPPTQNASGSNSHETNPLNPPTAAQFQELLQAMLEQQRQANESQAMLQRQANENQARFQEQMAKKDEEMTQVQRQLLKVLQNRPQPQL